MRKKPTMKTLPRTQFGHPVLRRKARQVPLSYLKTPAFRRLVRLMVGTMRRAEGVGLAAPQVGVPLRLAVMEMRPTPTRPTLPHKGPIVIVNPHIIKRSGTGEDWEGCLSLPGVRGKALRARGVVVAYLDADGKKTVERARGLWARVFQHEIDHLDGILYVDRMADMKTLITLSEFKKRVLAKRK